MTAQVLTLGYLPLTDAAPLIVAHELGFAAEEGLDLRLLRLASWAQSRDLLGAGVIDAAHMLVPMPIAQSLGLGPALPDVDLVMVLSQGGQVIAVSSDLATTMRAAGHSFDFADPVAAGSALLRGSGGRLRVGVPFPFSTQAELVWHWLGASGFDRAGVEVVTVPPPMMAGAVARGEVDAFCVGEPWASFAVETSVAALLLPGKAIWASPPEKGLVLRRDFIETRGDDTGRLMRAIWRAGRWLDRPENRGTAAEIVSRADYLNLPSELAERGLTGRLLVSPAGEMRQLRDFIAFHEGAATFPWKSLAAFFAGRIARRHGLEVAPAMERAMGCFRSDIYRQMLRPAGADLPGASAKVEGSMRHAHAVASEKGRMILRPDAFFDGHIFEPPFARR
ncbi:ABC transporter substrate-binding protein [Cereibacter sphaeroides]|uniref:ABC transporter substrate-binding protein n=1 Tax=Cereibacter sphaeroides TaxID=1063 RepID=UPI001F2CB6AA|nr:ABC transporter substrate-binding protein [Cereibacter sphaeroides]MCE6959195.1 ABC transporter substrate-binding protein [Cereibacter sphaeroides]MCE6968437.1 ABC transporter substrate-binding protein [Cereibacter sphaeroides]MCE6974144.1 ABC transporter substrate-binding protein [Cereibacter sphaeroides]